MNKFGILSVSLIILFPLMSYAQKTITASGEYTYRAPSSISVDEAKSIALERAKIQILADHFGTVMGVNNTTVVSNENGNSNVQFLSIGESEVQGEWLRTIGEPRYEEITFSQGMTIVTVSVKGEIREIKTARIPFVAKVLRGGTDERFESEKFSHGDKFFISFISPERGYLAIYLYDGKIVSRLLPSIDSGVGSFKVESRKEYVFFNRDPQYILQCEENSELDRIYIIFSPNKFSIALDSVQGDNLPASIDFDSFSRWLSRSRKQDSEMGVVMKDILITR